MKITVKAKVTDDSKNKLGKIESEFQNYQVYLQSGVPPTPPTPSFTNTTTLGPFMHTLNFNRDYMGSLARVVAIAPSP
jgi:hypothetical protein